MLDVTGAEGDVERLFNPTSVAVIGASSRPGALSWWPIKLLNVTGFSGNVFPVNPTRDEIEGHRCYDTIGDIPEQVDLAVIALNAEKTFGAVRDCVDAGVRSVVLPTQGFGEINEEGAVRQREIADYARQNGLRIMGPNTDGMANIETGAIASIQPLFDEGINSGSLGLVTQSGATASSLLYRLKLAGIGCRYYASAGNEIDLGLADYMSVMVQDPDVKIILSFVESLRRPDDFKKVARLAAELGKPIVLIKVGRSEQGARRAAAHTGSLAGSDQLYDALFADCGVIRVSELSEMVAVAKLYLTQGPPISSGVGIISVSGGQAAALADKASELSVPVPSVSAATEATLNAQLKFGKGFNPCDLTGEIATNPSLAKSVYEGFSSEPDIGTIIYARKHLTANAGVAASQMLGECATQEGAKPLAIYAMDGTIWGDEAKMYEQYNVPVFDNLNDLYAATDRLTWWRHNHAAAQSEREPLAAPASDQRPKGVVPDDTAKHLVAKAGMPLVRETVALDKASAIEAATTLGFPVVLKIVSDRIPHKTEAGGVLVDIHTPQEVGDGFDTLMTNARAYLDGDEADGVLVQEQVTGGTEMILGLKNDPDLGPFVVVGLGGILTELLKDVAIRPAPVDTATAHEMIDELEGKALLYGYRGMAPCDVEALAQTIADASVFGASQQDWLVEADFNPLLVLEQGKGVRAVDVLLVGKE